MQQITVIIEKLKDIFSDRTLKDFDKVTNCFSLLRWQREALSKDEFQILYCCFVNMYLIHGLHLTVPEDAKQHPEEDRMHDYFLSIRNDGRFLIYGQNEKELEENQQFFLSETKKLLNDEEEYQEFIQLYLGIYHQDRTCFQRLAEKNYPIVDYYLFYMDIQSHIYAMEQRKKESMSQKEYDSNKNQLCQSYKRYERHKKDKTSPFCKMGNSENNGSIETQGGGSQNVPPLPLPTIRYADSLCEELLACHFKLQNIHQNSINLEQSKGEIDSKLRHLLKNEQLGIIAEKGEKNQQNLFSNIPEIRMEFLMFPVKMDFDKNTFSLLMQSYLDNQKLEETNKMLEGKNRLLEREKLEKSELIKEHAHNWGHMSQPKIAYNLALELSRSGNFVHAQLTQKLYGEILLHYNDLKLLELKYISGSNSEFLNKFRVTLEYVEENPQDAKVLDYVIAEALELTLLRLLLSEKDDSESFHVSDFTKQKELRDSFTNFISKEPEKHEVFTWFKENLYEFQLTIQHEAWTGLIGFIEKDVAYSYMLQIFIDLLTNAMNYGLKSKEGYIHITLGYDKGYMVMSVENPIHRESAFKEGSGRGINSTKKSIARLNCSDELEQFTQITEENDIFQVKMKVFRDYLMKKGKGEK